ncbi:hypothetical protein [Chryseobacterium mucoviscidosis]|uniref:hypothetical protein n=1 Tax=Chryseobacterium mucoviscidosis TaxID=1945581 RepID=UPI003AFAB642
MKKILLTISSLVVVFSSAQTWNTAGNSGTNSSTDFLGTIDAQPLIFRTNNSEKVRITLNGSVGVGTTTPTQKLDVNGSVIANERYNNGNDGSYYIKLNSNGYNIPIISYLESSGNTLFFGNPGGQYHSKTIIQGGNGDVVLEPHSASSAFVVKAGSGNVGVGTTTPDNVQNWDKVLDIYASAHSKLLVRSLNVKTGIFSHETWGGAVGRIGTESNHDLRLMAGYGNDVMTLNTIGNVGIGINNPSRKLTVNGDIYGVAASSLTFQDDARFTVTNANVPNLSTSLNTFSMPQYGIAAPNTTGSADLWISGNNGIRMFTNGNPNPQFNLINGNVGIGNITPQAKLDVSGDVRIANIPTSTSSTDQALVVDSQGFLKKGLATSVNLTLSEKQKVNARATGYAIIAGKNPGVDFSVFVIPWDGVNTLEYNANNQINPSWHPQVVIKGNFFNQGFDGSDFTTYSSFVTSQSDFDLYKSTGTQWWIVCSTLPSFSKSITSNENTGNVAITNKLEAKEIKVTLTPTADFVFEKDYGLPKLEEVEKFVIENKHLPEIASAKEMEKEGVNVGEFQIKLLQKIEELTLYSIDLNKKNKEQEALIKSQTDILKSLNERLEKIEKAKQK